MEAVGSRGLDAARRSLTEIFGAAKRDCTYRTIVADQREYCIVGAGIHGLSTAWHLARELHATGRGDGRGVIILDKTGIRAGKGVIVGLGVAAIGLIADLLITRWARRRKEILGFG